MMKKKVRKKQLGGFNLPPSLTDLFSNGAPSFDQVMQLGTQLGANAGTNVFDKAFAQDDPNLIGGEVLAQGSFAQASQANPLLSQTDIQQQANEAAKKETFLGIGKKQKQRQYEALLQKQNDAKYQQNQFQGGINTANNGTDLVNASQLYNLLGNWLGQQGGSPFQGLPGGPPADTPAPGPIGVVPADNGKVTWDEANQITSGDEDYIKSLKDDSKGRAVVVALLNDMGFSKENVGQGAEGVNQNDVKGIKKPEDLIRVYKEIQGINMSPKKGADNKIDPGFLDYLAGHYKDFQYTQWGLDPTQLRKMQKGGNIKFMSSIQTILDANKDVPFVQRMYDPVETIPALKGKGQYATHEMAWGEADGKYVVFPTIFPGPDGKLMRPKDPFQYAVDNGETITLDSKRDAKNFAAGAWKKVVTKDIHGSPITYKYGGKAELGYSDGSPYKYLPEIDIPGNNITMANTGQHLLAIPDRGAPKVMAPYSGTHIFPGASQVKEIPMQHMKMGGRKGKRKIPYYQAGGDTPDASMPGDPPDDNGQGQQEAPIPPAGVQIEVGEVFSTPELDIIDTHAREKHKDMDKELITDVLRGKDYVFSNDPKMNIKKTRAEDVSFGLGGVFYKEGEIGDLPKEYTAAELFDKNQKEMTPAEYVKDIRKAYPMTDREDVFSKKDNSSNKKSRIPYLAAAVLFNEEKRTKGKAPMTGFVTNFEDKFDKAYTATANQDNTQGQYGTFGDTPPPTSKPEDADVQQKKYGGDVQHLQKVGGGGGLDFAGVGAVANLASSILGVFTSAGQGRTARRALLADRPLIDQQAQTEGQFSDASYGAQLLGYTNQNPKVLAPQYDSTQLDARVRRTPDSVFEMASSRATAGNRPYLDALISNSGDYATAANAYQPANASGISALASLGSDQVNRDTALENQYRDMKQNFDDRQILADNTAANATNTNVNQLTGAIGTTLGSGISSRGKIATSRLQALRDNNLQQAQAKIDASQALTAAIQNAGASAGYAGSTIQHGIDLKNAGVDNNVTTRSDNLGLDASALGSANRSGIPPLPPGVDPNDSNWSLVPNGKGGLTWAYTPQ